MALKKRAFYAKGQESLYIENDPKNPHATPQYVCLCNGADVASSGFCTHSLDAKSQFQRLVTQTTKNILDAIKDYRTMFPLQGMIAYANTHTLPAGSVHELYTLNALLYDIDQALNSGTIDFGKALVLDETVSCTGMTHRCCLTNICIACRLSAVLSTFDTVQTLYHLGESTQITSIQGLCSLLFAQIKSTDKSYDSETAKGYSEPLLEVQKGYQRSGAGASQVSESRDVIRESSRRYNHDPSLANYEVLGTINRTIEPLVATAFGLDNEVTTTSSSSEV
jgi:hypothetical protein